MVINKTVTAFIALGLIVSSASFAMKIRNKSFTSSGSVALSRNKNQQIRLDDNKTKAALKSQEIRFSDTTIQEKSPQIKLDSSAPKNIDMSNIRFDDGKATTTVKNPKVEFKEDKTK